MKPFDIELARKGHAVCYRDGTVPEEMHILPEWAECGDRWPVITRVGTWVHPHKATGRYYVNDTADSSLDLFMKTEKKTKWVNLFSATVPQPLYETEEKARAALPAGCPAITAKVEWEE